MPVAVAQAFVGSPGRGAAVALERRRIQPHAVAGGRSPARRAGGKRVLRRPALGSRLGGRRARSRSTGSVPPAAARPARPRPPACRRREAPPRRPRASPRAAVRAAGGSAATPWPPPRPPLRQAPADVAAVASPAARCNAREGSATAPRGDLRRSDPPVKQVEDHARRRRRPGRPPPPGRRRLVEVGGEQKTPKPAAAAAQCRPRCQRRRGPAGPGSR